MSDTPPLLLGATGFLGRQVAARVPTAEAPDRLDVDLEDPGEVRALLADSPPRTVFLCAGALPDADPLAMARLNTRLPVLLVELLPAGSTLVLAGSVAEVGGRDVHEETPCRPTTAYGRSKATGAGAALQIGPTRGVRVVAPRFFQLYGPGEAPHRLLPSLRRAARTGEPLPLSSGRQLRDFTWVGDAADAMVALAGHPDAQGVVNVATGRLTSVEAFARAVAEALGLDPGLLRFGARRPGPEGEDPWAHDAVPLHRLRALGLSPPAVSLAEGIPLALSD
ncbi:MAG: NAD(P)-dependent oxidoreductase [Alphaproteobacteria bacterium]|nr:NAD(P)-dependent oxidoreductase [Alphaproteobacteria bacterium]